MFISLVGVFFTAGFMAWILYEFWPDRIVFSAGKIVKKRKWKTEKIPIVELSQIDFHYHAAVGFVCAWEFTSKSGKSLLVEGSGIDGKLLSDLERHLPNFSVEKFHEQFKDGDVEDTIEVWKAA